MRLSVPNDLTVRQSPCGTPTRQRHRRFNDDRIKKAIQTVRERQLAAGKNNTTLSEHALIENSTDQKTRLPPLRAVSTITEVPKYYKAMKRATLWNAALGGVTILVAFVEGELTRSNEYEHSWLADLLRALAIVLALIQVIFILQFYQAMLKTRIARGLAHFGTSLLLDRELCLSALAEVSIMLLLSPPGFYVTVDLSPLQPEHTILTASDLLFGLICIRFYQLFKWVDWRMRYPQDYFVFELQRITKPFSFRFKGFLSSPFQTMLILYCGVLCVGGMLVRTFERSVPRTYMNDVYDGFWLLSETQATLGFGEISIESALTKLVCCAAAFAGVFTNSIIVSSLLNTTKLSVKELQFAMHMQRLSKRRYSSLSIVLLQRWWRLLFARKHDARMRYVQLLKFYAQVNMFRHRLMAGSGQQTPELDEALDCARNSIQRKFVETVRPLRGILNCKSDLAGICTEQVSIFLTLLWIKRNSINLRRLVVKRRKKSSKIRTIQRRMASTKRQKKIASELAYKKMLVRLARQSSVSEHSLPRSTTDAY